MPGKPSSQLSSMPDPQLISEDFHASIMHNERGLALSLTSCNVPLPTGHASLSSHWCTANQPLQLIWAGGFGHGCLKGDDTGFVEVC